MPNLSRAELVRDADSEQRATTLELFYDLVFVFAITQVSHLLLDNLTWEGAGQAALVLLVVWWAWNYTTWVTNELDPDSVRRPAPADRDHARQPADGGRDPGRVRRPGAAVRGLVRRDPGRAPSVPHVRRRRPRHDRARAGGRILIWFVAAGVLWIAGALADGPARAALWLVALAIDYGAPLVTYWVPGRPRLDPEAWDVETAHFAERFQLFVIIALGRVDRGHRRDDVASSSSTPRGWSRSRSPSSAPPRSGGCTSTTSRRSRSARSSWRRNRTLLARDAYTYLHVVIVAGDHPRRGRRRDRDRPPDRRAARPRSSPWSSAARRCTCSRTAAVRLRVTGRISLRRIGGAVACFAIAPIAAFAPALFVAGALLAVLIGVIVADQVVAARRTGGRTRARTA